MSRISRYLCLQNVQPLDALSLVNLSSVSRQMVVSNISAVTNAKNTAVAGNMVTDAVTKHLQRFSSSVIKPITYVASLGT